MPEIKRPYLSTCTEEHAEAGVPMGMDLNTISSTHTQRLSLSEASLPFSPSPFPRLRSSLFRCLSGLRCEWPHKCHRAKSQAASFLALPPGEDLRKTGWSCLVRDLRESLDFPLWLRLEQCAGRSGLAPWVSEIAASSFATWACRGHATKPLFCAFYRWQE